MKKLFITSIFALLLTGAGAMKTQDIPDEYLGLPGDNLNLYAVMKLFQESETLEGFERKLNDENSRINNLDLNRDNLVDYITVSDYVDGNVHTIVLRAVLSRNETQDVAVFTVEKLRNGEVRIQLVGDEALYGKNYIIEPNYAETPNPGYLGNQTQVKVVTTTYYEVAAWPVVRFIFLPGYIVWHSSWYWGYYPHYWNPWSPWYWHYYYGYHYNWYPHYYQHFHHAHHFYYEHYQDHYYSHIRTHSPYVSAGIREGRYNTTYSRPEQRREGEALYARTYTSRTARPQTGVSTDVRGSRTNSQVAQTSRTVNSGTATSRRPNEVASSNTRPVTSSRQYSSPSGRSNTTTYGRTGSSSATQRVAPTRQSGNTSVGRTASRPAVSSQSTGSRSTSTSGSTRYNATTGSSRQAGPTQKINSSSVGRTSSGSAVSNHVTSTRSSSPSFSQRSSSGHSSGIQRTAPSRSSGHSVSSSGSVSRGSGQVSRSSASSSRSSTSRTSSAGSAHHR